ncbi:MAG: PilW family protein [Gammaproteobacteria bacterium]|nr:PilW family protein [Gammaproteobacteria bacterium]MDH4253375.1 PilW family protein [Gammaproteobacteria bacterium]MDH5310314.1 PilW family protein [Gammaproteobacteria bacterium]
MTRSTHCRQSGMTMVELLIGMILSLVVGAAIVTTFVNNRQSFKQDENILRLQDDARHALREIAFDLSMAGHYADLLVPGSVVQDISLSIGTDCGPAGIAEWMYQTTLPGTGESLSVVALDNAGAATATANFSCISPGEIQAGTDVVSIKRVAGARSAAPSAGSVYLRTNGTVGLLFREPMAGAPAVVVPAPSADWEYRPSIYYVRNFATTPADGIPTLCRKVLRGFGPSMTTECLATGIENLQVEYGIDTTDDGNPDVFLTNPTIVQMQDVVSARVFLLARTTEIDVGYENDKTYQLSNAPAYTPNDEFHRHIFATTVTIQNIRSMNIMGF